MAYCLINKSNYFHNLSKIEQKIDKDKIDIFIKEYAREKIMKKMAAHILALV